jgi:hypothetical protein
MIDDIEGDWNPGSKRNRAAARRSEAQQRDGHLLMI